MSADFSRYRRGASLAATVLLGTALLLSGCKHQAAPGVKNSDGSTTNADGSVTYPPGTSPTPAAAAAAPTPTVNPDGSTTNPDGSVTYPAGLARAQSEKQPSVNQSAAQQPAPVQQPPEQAAQQVAPPPPPPPPPRVPRVVRSGTAVPITLTETLSASKNNAGDSFSGVLQQSIVSQNGAVVFARGTRVAGVVTAAKGKGRFKGSGDLAIELTSIGGTRVSTTGYEAANKGRGKRTAGFIGGGGGLGALIGGLAGGGKGALIGGLAGAGAGTAGAAYTGNRDVVIPSESSITFRLTAPVTLR
jgi:hypothetical protein